MMRKPKSYVQADRRLPPLNSLRAFEAAARHLSFVLAAQELHVTPAAVSHQIKGLEDQLGVRLFRRLPRGLELTQAGEAGLPALREGFDLLAEAVEQTRARIESAMLVVSAAPSFVTRWLAPRLHRFVSAHPDLDVKINASTRLVDPEKDAPAASEEHAGSPIEDADVAIRFGTGEYPGFRSEKLLAAVVTPMCSPRLLGGRHPLRAPEDLRHHVLIHDNVHFGDGRRTWDAWLDAEGVHGVDTSRGLRFNHAMLALDAAADGLGVTLGMPLLAGADLAAGRLVMPFRRALPLKFAYYIVSTQENAKRDDVTAFRNWLLEEAARDSDAGSRSSV
jgi:LysR family glycine cleavage system transcriptional activator